MFIPLEVRLDDTDPFLDMWPVPYKRDNVAKWLAWAELSDLFEPDDREELEMAEAWIPVRLRDAASLWTANSDRHIDTTAIMPFAGMYAVITYPNSD